LAHDTAIRHCRRLGKTAHRARPTDHRQTGQQQGYHTACIGKWHLGSDWPITPEQKAHFTGFGGKPGGGGQVSTTITDAHRETWKAVFSQRISGGPTERGF
jgi:arylsulfatase A